MAYAIEELVAELGAAFLCADLDLTREPREDYAAYIADWLIRPIDILYVVTYSHTEPL